MTEQAPESERGREITRSMGQFAGLLWEAAAAGDRPKVQTLLRAAGYPADQARLVDAIAQRADDDLLALARAWGAPGAAENDVAAQLRVILARSDDTSAALRRMVKAAGYPKGVAGAVVTLLERYAADAAPDGVLPVRDAMRLLDTADADLAALARTWGPAGGQGDNLAAQLRVVLGRAEIDTEAVAAALRSAGYPKDAARLLESRDEDLSRLLRVWGPVGEERNNLAAQLRLVLGRGEVGEAEVAAVLRAAGYSKGVIERFLHPVEEPVDPELRRLLRAWGPAGDEANDLAAQLRVVLGRGEVGEAEVSTVLRAAGYSKRAIEKLLHPVEPVPPSEPEPVDPDLRRLQRAWGPAGEESNDLTAQLRVVLRRGEVGEAEVSTVLRAAGYSKRAIEKFLHPVEPVPPPPAEPVDPDLRRLQRAWGPAGDEANDIAAQLRVVLRRGEVGEAEVSTVLRAAGYSKGAIEKFLHPVEPVKPPPAEPVDPDLRRLQRAWGPAGDETNDLTAQLRVVLGRGEVGEAEVAAVLRAAGYSKRAIEKFLHPVEPVPPPPAEPVDPDLRRLQRAWGPAGDEANDIAAQLRVVLRRGEVGEAEVSTVLRAAGYSKGAIEKFLHPVEPVKPPPEPVDPDLRRFLRAWGPAGDDTNDLKAQLRVVLGRGEPGTDEVTSVLRTVGYPKDVTDLAVALLERYRDPEVDVPGLSVRDLTRLLGEVTPGDVTRTLWSLGYPKAVSGLVAGLLLRFPDSDAMSSGLQVRDIAGMIEAIDDDLLGILRGWSTPPGDPNRLRAELRAILSRHGLDLELAGAFAALAMPDDGGLEVVTDETTPAGDAGRIALQRVLRAAGTPPDLARLVGKLLQRFATGEEVMTPSVRDIADFVESADDDLLGLIRTWRGSEGDLNRVRAQFKTLLRHQGVDDELAAAISALVLRESTEVDLAEVVRIGRLAHTAEDACVSIAEPAWLQDPRFVDAYAEAKGVAAWGRDIRWRVQTLVKLGAAATHLPGDFVECGVDTGGTARAVMAYLGDESFADRRFYLFDTFRGMVPEQLTEEEQVTDETRGDRYPDVSDVVRSNFADKPFVRIVQGAVPETLADYDGQRVAYLHIDMNATVPEVGALRHFWPLLSPGAPVVFDDYGFPRHAPQRRALDAVAAEFGVEIIMLPTCQGLLIKPAGPEE